LPDATYKSVHPSEHQSAQQTAAKSADKSTSRATIKILYAESDENTLSGQAAEMKAAGHEVTTAVNRQDVQAALKRDAFDLVILGASMSKDDRHHLPYMVKKSHEGTKVLVMHAGTHHHEVDAVVDSNLSMQRILERIAALLQPEAVR
jgi:DNA-binding NtrC family response regulator